MSFREAQATVDRWVSQFDEGYFPRSASCLANSQRIDLDQAFAAMMQKVTARDADRWTRKGR